MLIDSFMPLFDFDRGEQATILRVMVKCFIGKQMIETFGIGSSLKMAGMNIRIGSEAI